MRSLEQLPVPHDVSEQNVPSPSCGNNHGGDGGLYADRLPTDDSHMLHVFTWFIHRCSTLKGGGDYRCRLASSANSSTASRSSDPKKAVEPSYSEAVGTFFLPIVLLFIHLLFSSCLLPSFLCLISFLQVLLSLFETMKNWKLSAI